VDKSNLAGADVPVPSTSFGLVSLLLLLPLSLPLLMV